MCTDSTRNKCVEPHYYLPPAWILSGLRTPPWLSSYSAIPRQPRLRPVGIRLRFEGATRSKPTRATAGDSERETGNSSAKQSGVLVVCSQTDLIVLGHRQALSAHGKRHSSAFVLPHAIHFSLKCTAKKNGEKRSLSAIYFVIRQVD